MPIKPGTGGSQSLSRDQMNDLAYEQYKSNLVPCENCGRTFNADRLSIHLKSCKPGQTAKPVGTVGPRGSLQMSPSSSVAAPPPARPSTVGDQRRRSSASSVSSEPSTPSTASVEQWSVGRVHEFFKKLGFDKAAAAVREGGVNGRTLLQLDEQDMHEELGLTKLQVIGSFVRSPCTITPTCSQYIDEMHMGSRFFVSYDFQC